MLSPSVIRSRAGLSAGLRDPSGRHSPSELAEPTGDDEVCAGDEAGVRGGQEQRSGPDFLAGAQPSQRDGGGDLLPKLGGYGAEERGVDRTGTDDIYPDTADLQLRGPGARE